MPYEDALRDSLRYLYSEASGFQISIDIIVKLAKSLKLDTFVEDETPGVKRLSIAGSLLLLEIDFSDDHTVSKVSLSSGNHSSETVSENILDRITENVLSENEGSGLEKSKSIVLSFQPELRASFLRTSSGNMAENAPENGDKTSTIAEKILLESLAGPTLRTFPKNLKYLADLDRVSPSEGDLIVYIDNLATYLAAIHATEIKLNPDNWEVAEGFSNSFGRVLLNDEDTNDVGVYLQFWQDSHVINHELRKRNEPRVGKTFSALLAIEESKTPALDYILEAKSKAWLLTDKAGERAPYFFYGKSDSGHLHNEQSVTVNAQWRLVLRFDEPVYLQKNVLDYYGITDYECAKPAELCEFYNYAVDSGELKFSILGTDFSFLFEEVSPYVRLSAITLPNLHVLSELIPALRNQLVLTSFLESVALSRKRVLNKASPSEINRETKRRIRDSLQLSSDVPDEELLGLNTISSDYMGVQMLDRDPELGDFIKSESENSDMRDEVEDEEQPKIGSPSVVITLHEVCYGEPHSDYVIGITGEIGQSEKQGKVDAQVRIQNGKIITSEDISMEEEDVSNLFIKYLALSEDVPLALEAMQ